MQFQKKPTHHHELVGQAPAAAGVFEASHTVDVLCHNLAQNLAGHNQGTQ